MEEERGEVPFAAARPVHARYWDHSPFLPRQQQINEAEGAAAAILAIASATAEGLRKVADATQVQGGYEAVQLRVAEQYITKFGELAKAGNTLVLPASVSDIGSMMALAMNVIGKKPEPRSKA